jgi:hypothetical protein
MFLTMHVRRAVWNKFHESVTAGIYGLDSKMA